MSSKECPKWGREFLEERLWTYERIRIGKAGSLIGWIDIVGDNIRSFHHENYGIIELQKER